MAASLILMAPVARAEVKVTAKLSPNPVEVNHVTNLTITVENGELQLLPEPNLPPPMGLAGGPTTSQNISIINGAQTATTQIIWPISSPQVGVATIPPIQVQVSGKTYSTRELKVEFTAASSTPKPEGPNSRNGRNNLDSILQLQIGKTEFYQGEVVPITATLYVPQSVTLLRTGLIEVEKSDFAIQRFPQAGDQSLEILGQVRYRSFTYQSTLSALKPGKTTIGPAKMEILVEVPVGNQNSGFPFGFMQTARQKITVPATEIPVNVLPLPTEGRPASFTGAVGDFSLKASASTQEATVGDPVSVELVIEGQGNFDALEAPRLTKQDGWKLYPPRRYNVDASDPNTVDMLHRGVGFSTIMVPEKVMAEVPPFEFSFFNSRDKKYVTVHSSSIPIAIKPSDKVAPPVLTEAAGGTIAPKPNANPAPVAEITDIVMRLPAVPRWALASMPLMEDARFKAINALLGLAFLGLIGAALFKRWRQRQINSEDQERREQLWQVESPGLSEAEFYRRAAQYLHRYGGGNVPKAAETLLQKYETLNFAGPQAGSGPVDPADRAEALAVLKQLKPKRPSASSHPVITTLLLLMAASTVHAAETAPESRYQAAVQALEKEDFQKAQKLGEELIKDGYIGPELFALIGNAVYKQKDLGGAAIWYQRALLFPGAISEVRQNLRHIQEKTHFFSFRDSGIAEPLVLLASRNQWALAGCLGGWLVIFGTAFLLLTGWARPLWGWVLTILAGTLLIWGGLSMGADASSGWLRVLALIAGVLVTLSGTLGLILHLMVRSRYRLPMGLMIGAGFLLLLCGSIGLAFRPTHDLLEHLAYVTGSEVQAHTAAAEISGNVIAVPAGSTVRRFDERGAWCYVEIPQDGENLYGWLLAKDLVPVWPFDPKKLP